MSEYTSSISVKPLQGIQYQLEKDLTWEIGKLGTGIFISVPSSTVFDVSIPRWARWIFNPHDQRFLKAAALHDYMLNNDWSPVLAASIFHDALEAENVTRIEILVMYIAVLIHTYK